MCATVCPSQALFFGTREEIEQLRPQSTPINQLPVRRADDHDEGEHDGAARVGAAEPHVDVTAAMDERPRTRTIRVAGRAGRRRPVRRGAGAMDESHRPIEPTLDVRSTRRARRADRHDAADVYAAAASRTRSPSRPTAARCDEQPRWRQRLPDRLAAGPVRRAPRLHEVPGAHQPGVRRRPALDRGAEPAGAAGAGSRRCARIASLDRRAGRRRR